MRPFNFTKSKNAASAVLSKKTDAQFVAGGTNLLDLMKKHIAEPAVLVDITTAVPQKVESTTKGVRIGAMMRNSALANDPVIKEKFPLLSKAILAGASPQIRNMASTGGNLLQRTRCPYFYDVTTPCNKRKAGSGCSAINGENRMNAIVGYSEQCVAVHPSDMCVALAVFDSAVNVMGKDQKSSTIPFRDFHRIPGDKPAQDNHLPLNALITSIDISQNNFGRNYAYVKLRDRDSYAFALVSVAAALHLQGNKIVEARLASGGVAHKPWRWFEAEQFLKGKEAIPSNFAEAAKMAVNTVKPLSKNEFKVGLLQGAIETALQNCLTA